MQVAPMARFRPALANQTATRARLVMLAEMHGGEPATASSK